MFEKDTGMPVGAGSTGLDLAEIYTIKCIRDTMRIKAPNKTTLSVPRDCEAALVALSVFAPGGVGTILPRSNLSLVETSTGRTIEFPAQHMKDIASLVSAFAVIWDTGEPIRQMEKAASLPSVIFDPPSRDLSTIPAWIAEHPDLKPTLVEDDGRIVLSFASVTMSSKSKYLVECRCESGVPDHWGYEVSADGQPFGWVVLMEPGIVLVTGAGSTPYSKHRNIRSAMFRLSSHLNGAQSE
jgi:hypothetical protein